MLLLVGGTITSIPLSILHKYHKYRLDLQVVQCLILDSMAHFVCMCKCMYVYAEVESDQLE